MCYQTLLVPSTATDENENNKNWSNMFLFVHEKFIFLLFFYCLHSKCFVVKSNSWTNGSNFYVGKGKISVGVCVRWTRPVWWCIEPPHFLILKIAPPRHDEDHFLLHCLAHTRHSAHIWLAKMRAVIIRYDIIAVKLQIRGRIQFISISKSVNLIHIPKVDWWYGHFECNCVEFLSNFRYQFHHQ